MIRTPLKKIFKKTDPKEIAEISVKESRPQTDRLRQVNAQLKAEIEERRQVEERLKILFELAPDAYYLNDIKGRFVDGNKAAEALIGYKRDELIGKSFLELKILPLAHIGKAAALLAQSAMGNATGPDELNLIHRDGSRVPVEIRTFPVVIHDERLVLGIARDISERKRSEAMLMHRNLMLEMLNELSMAVSKTLEVGPMMNKVAEFTCEALSATSAYICAWKEEEHKSVVLGEYISSEAVDRERVSDLGSEYEQTRDLQQILDVQRAHFVDHLDSPELSQQDHARMKKFGVQSILGVPLFADDKPIGFIEIWESRKRREFTDVEIELVRAICRQVGMSIDQARLHEAIRVRSRLLEEQKVELESLNLRLKAENDERLKAEEAEREQRVLAEALRDSVAAVNSTLDKDAVLDQILDSIAGVFPHDAANIMLVKSGVAFVARWKGYDKQGDDQWLKNVTLKIADIPNLHEMELSGAPVVVPDTRAFPQWYVYSGSEWIRSNASSPIRHAGKTIGFLTLDSDSPGTFNDDHAEALKIFADQVAVAIRNATLFEDTRTRLAELTKLWQVGSAVVSELTSSEILEFVVQNAAELIQADSASICLISPDEKSRSYVAASGSAANVLQDQFEKRGEGLEGFVILSGEPILVSNPQKDPRVSSLMRNIHANGAIVAPLKAKGQMFGTLSAYSIESNAEFSKHDLDLITAFADYAAISIFNARLYQTIQRHASELEQASQELQTANKHLKSLSQAKDEFVSNVSHELRTPIASLKIYHQLLLKSPDKIETLTKTLKHETSQLEHIIEDLLFLSRMEMGLPDSSFIDLKLGSLARACVLDRTSLAESRNLSLTHEIYDDDQTIRGDKGLLYQALSTILTNALNYTPEGGQIVVGTSTQSYNGQKWAGFFVRDSGPGIQPDEIDHIFDRFFRGKAGQRSKAPGTGLGLSIAKKIVDQHNGRIEVCNNDDAFSRGTTFSIWLPIQPERISQEPRQRLNLA